MNHTSACQQRQEQLLVSYVDYFTRYPCACQACHVEGGTTTLATFWDNAEWFNCPVCIDSCPRCRNTDDSERKDFIVESLPCPQCGYNWGASDGDFPPSVIDECDCGEYYEAN